MMRAKCVQGNWLLPLAGPSGQLEAAYGPVMSEVDVESGAREADTQTTDPRPSRTRRLTVRFYGDTRSTLPRVEPLRQPPPWAPIDPATLDTSPWAQRVRAHLSRDDQSQAAAAEATALSGYDYVLFNFIMSCCTCCCSRRVLVSARRQQPSADRIDGRTPRETFAQQIDAAWDGCLWGMCQYPRWWCAYLCCACDSEDDEQLGASLCASCVRRIVQPIVLLAVIASALGVVYFLLMTAILVPMAIL